MDDFEPSLPKVQRNLQKVPSFEKKSDENEVDLMGWAQVMYQDESRNSPFNHEKAWAILRQQAKWDAPEVAPVELTEDETDDFHAMVNTDELFGADTRPRPPANNAPEKKPNPTHRLAPGKSIVPIRPDDSPDAVRRLLGPWIVLPTKKNRLEGDPRPEPRDPPSDGQVRIV
nr:hypothetical protein [Tanacetum cinerariifolium]